jgi:hypothetical protein
VYSQPDHAPQKKLSVLAKPGAEPDSVLEGRRQDIPGYEVQLKALHKALEAIRRQRRDMGSCYEDMAGQFAALSTLDTEAGLVQDLKKLGRIHSNLRALHSDKVGAVLSPPPAIAAPATRPLLSAH